MRPLIVPVLNMQGKGGPGNKGSASIKRTKCTGGGEDSLYNFLCAEKTSEYNIGI